MFRKKQPNQNDTAKQAVGIKAIQAKLNASKKAKAEAKAQRDAAFLNHQAEFNALNQKQKNKLKKIVKTHPAFVKELNAPGSALTLEVVLKLAQVGHAAKFAKSLSATPAIKAVEGQDDEIDIALNADNLITPAEEEAVADVTAETPNQPASQYKQRSLAVKFAKEQHSNLDLSSQISLRAILKKYPALIAAVKSEHAAVDAVLVLQIKKQGGIKNLAANIENGLIHTFAETWAGLNQERRAQLFSIDSKKFAQLQAFFESAKLNGNAIVVGSYVDDLAKLSDDEFNTAINLDPSYLQLVYIQKTHDLKDALKVERKVTDENMPVTYKQQNVVKINFNLGKTTDYIRACIDVARARANKINHWYYWNGRSKASEIFAAISAIEKQYLNVKAGSLPPFTADFVLTTFKAKVGDKEKSLTEVLNTHRHHSFFRSKTKVTTSISLFNNVEAPKLN